MGKPLWSMETGVPGVRLAEKKDEGEIFALLCLLHAENGFFSMNRDKVIAGIQWATERKGGIIYVIDEGPRVVATLGMMITSEWYSDEEYLHERWNYVHPDYRRSDYAQKLLNQAMWAHEWFKLRGKSMPFFCGINSLRRTEAKIRMYARVMPCIGAYFAYGEGSRQRELVQREVLAIKDQNGKSRRERSLEVRPVVETVIRVSRRQEDSYV
ncbi:MAG TPA: GNAT family N-acetyltransferase [Hyphomicrobiaceae bacterium]|jgi:GNAT superfamily N-acetyltransferase